MVTMTYELMRGHALDTAGASVILSIPSNANK